MTDPDLRSQTPQMVLENDEPDLLAHLKTLAVYRWTIVLTTFFCFATATALAFVMTPKYQAEVILSIAEEQKSSGLGALAGQLGGLAEMAGVSTGAGGAKESSIAYLKSRGFVEKFIKENDLLPILFAKKWDAANKKWNIDKAEDVPTLWDGYKFFSKKVMAVNVDKKTGLVTLVLVWKDRNQVVEWANDMIQRANSDLRQRTINETQLSLTYLEKELAKTSVVEIQQAIFRVMESQIKTMMMANVRDQFAFKVIDAAAVVDEDDFVKPNRPLIMVVGLLLGLFLGVVLAFGRNFAAQPKFPAPKT